MPPSDCKGGNRYASIHAVGVEEIELPSRCRNSQRIPPTGRHQPPRRIQSTGRRHRRSQPRSPSPNPAGDIRTLIRGLAKTHGCYERALCKRLPPSRSTSHTQQRRDSHCDGTAQTLPARKGSVLSGHLKDRSNSELTKLVRREERLR